MDSGRFLPSASECGGDAVGYRSLILMVIVIVKVIIVYYCIIVAVTCGSSVTDFSISSFHLLFYN